MLLYQEILEKKGQYKYKEKRKEIPFPEEIKREIISKLESVNIISYIPSRNSLLMAAPPEEVTLKKVIDTVGSSIIKVPSFLRNELSKKLSPISEELEKKESDILEDITIADIIEK